MSPNDRVEVQMFDNGTEPAGVWKPGRITYADRCDFLIKLDDGRVFNLRKTDQRIREPVL